MRRILFSLSVFALVAYFVGSVVASYTDSVGIINNDFVAGTFQLQLSTTDTNGDNVGDTHPANWLDSTQSLWDSPAGWQPGESFSNSVFLRDAGSVDIASLQFRLANLQRATTPNFDAVVLLTDAWYDRNGDGQRQPEDELLPALIGSYDANQNGSLTLSELYTGTTTLSYELEPATDILPGSILSPNLGGENGTGKGLFLQWQYDATASIEYQGGRVGVDLLFQGSNEE